MAVSHGEVDPAHVPRVHVQLVCDAVHHQLNGGHTIHRACEVRRRVRLEDPHRHIQLLIAELEGTQYSGFETANYTQRLLIKKYHAL